MAVSSAARVAASRANAARSTGPKTTPGKHRSRCNAIKHGCSGQGVALLPEDQDLVAHRLTCWTEELGAQGDLESVLVAEAATASVLRRRALLAEAGLARKRADRLVARRQNQRRRRLEAFDHRLDQWERLIAVIQREGYLPYSWESALMHLLGRPEKSLNSCQEDWAATMRALNHQAFTTVDPKPTGESPPPALNPGRDGLVRLLEAWRADLKVHRDELARQAEAIDQADLDRADAWFDPSPQAERLRRYAMAAERSLYRALTHLDRVRRLPDSPLADAADEAADEARNEARRDERTTGCVSSQADPTPIGEAGSAAETGGEAATGPDAAPPAREGTTAVGSEARNEARRDEFATGCGSLEASRSGSDSVDSAWLLTHGPTPPSPGTESQPGNLATPEGSPW
jgi:hypothetical protein